MWLNRIQNIWCVWSTTTNRPLPVILNIQFKMPASLSEWWLRYYGHKCSCCVNISMNRRATTGTVYSTCNHQLTPCGTINTRSVCAWPFIADGCLLNTFVWRGNSTFKRPSMPLSFIMITTTLMDDTQELKLGKHWQSNEQKGEFSWHSSLPKNYYNIHLFFPLEIQSHLVDSDGVDQWDRWFGINCHP